MTETTPIDQLSYEKASAELEELLDLLEAEDIALEESLRLYERGQLLVQHCARLLDAAELRLQQLTPGAMGGES